MTTIQLTVVATGAADGPDPVAFARNSPSFFADPVAWLVTAAVADAVGPCAADIAAAADSTGIIVVSQLCTTTTMRALSRTAGRGLVSPLRFAGANPGVLAGLPCITWKLRGPSLVLAADPDISMPVVTAVAQDWLALGQATHVLLVVHWAAAAGHSARCAVVRAACPGDTGGQAGELPGADRR
jgi:hypothetical protein